MAETQHADEGGNSTRRGILKAAGIAAAAVGAGQLVGQAGASAAPIAGSGASVRLDVVDFVDEQYVIEARAEVAGSALSAPLRMRDGLSVEVTSGGTVVEDPYTGEILVKPVAGEQVVVQATVKPGTAAAAAAGITGSSTVGSGSTVIGIYPGRMSTAESSIAAAGGGACAAIASADSAKQIVSSMLAHLSPDRQAAVAAVGTAAVSTELRVRAAVMGNVIPFSDTHREIRWQHARYYGTDSVLGLLRFTYQQDKLSAASMDSLGGSTFFPARAQNVVYCRMELLDLGAAAISDDPMVLPVASMNWPIYATPMELSAPVTFYDETAPDREIMQIVKNEMRLYDYNGVTIRKLASNVTAAGVLRTAFEVSNQTGSVFTGRWMMIGDHTDTTFASTDAPLTLGPAGSKTATTVVEVNAPIQKRLLSQRVAFAVMSLSDPVVLGITPITFKFPNA